MNKVILAVLKDMYSHKYTYILRASLLQLVVTTFGAFVLSLIMRVILVSSDLPGLTTDNLTSFFGNPLTLVLLLVYIFALAFLIYFEFSILVEMLRLKETRLQLTLTRLVEDSKYFLKSLSNWHILIFLFYLVLTLPFFGIIMSSALLENIYIPQFISGELLKSDTGTLLYYGLYVAFGYFNLRFIYTLPLTVTGKGQRFGHNMIESWRLTKGRKILDLLGLVLVLVILLAFFGILIFLVIGIANLLGSNSNNFLMKLLFLAFIWGVIFAANLIFKLTSLSYLLRLLGREKAEQISLVSKKSTKKNLLSLALLLIVIGGIHFLYTSSQISGNPSKNLKVFAHRGFVSKGVENSLEALEGAAKAGADYVEMDIILSSDNHFIVSHDDNLERLTGKDISISKSKASQLLGLKTSQSGHHSTLVSFEEYVAKAKKLGVNLLVELKPTGSEPANYEQLFVDKMKELGVGQNYLVMSADLPTIEKVENLDSSLQTGYTISLQIGDFTSQKVDFYVVEDFSYNEFLARHAHNSHKKIYAWTINSSDDIQNYLQTSVDGIITDYPNLVTRLKAETKDDISYLDYFLNLINAS